MHVESFDVLEDPVTGHEFQTQHGRSSGNPPVGLMDLLHQRIISRAETRLRSQLGATGDEPFTRLDDLQIGDRSLKLAAT